MTPCGACPNGARLLTLGGTVNLTKGRHMTPRLALIALLTLPLAACEGTGLPGFGSTEAETQPVGHKGPPTVSPLQQPIETGASTPRAIATAESRTLNTTAFTARGNEPFWRVDAAGNTAIYRTAENQNGRAVQVSRLTFAQGVEYIGTLNGRPFVLNIRGQDCQDSMSGERFGMSASLTVSGRTTAGCAGPATAEVAAAVAATRAPAPAAPRATARPAATRPAPTPVAAETPEAPAETPATTPAPEAPAATAPSPAAEPPAPASTTPAATTTPSGEGAAATPPAAPAPDTTEDTPAAPPVIPPAPAATEPEEEAPAAE